jgi:hypothetical protein
MASFRTDGVTFNTSTGTKTVVLTSAVGDVFIVFAANSGQVATPTVSDNQPGGSYSLVTSALKATSADLLCVFVRNNPFNVAASTTVTMTPGTTTGGGLNVIAVQGMFFGGLGAVRQSKAQANQAAGGTPAPIFDAAVLTGNMCLGAVFSALNPATLTPSASWTERRDVGYITPTEGIETQSIDSGFTGTTVTWGSTSAAAFGDVVLELDATQPFLGSILEYI